MFVLPSKDRNSFLASSCRIYCSVGLMHDERLPLEILTRPGRFLTWHCHLLKDFRRYSLYASFLQGISMCTLLDLEAILIHQNLLLFY